MDRLRRKARLHGLVVLSPALPTQRGDIEEEKTYHRPRDNIDYLIRGVMLKFRLIDCLYSLPKTGERSLGC